MNIPIMMSATHWFPVVFYVILDVTICGKSSKTNSTHSMKTNLCPDKFLSRSPYLGDTETRITVQQGEPAFFNCRVFNLANQTVSFRQIYCSNLT